MFGWNQPHKIIIQCDQVLDTFGSFTPYLIPIFGVVRTLAQVTYYQFAYVHPSL